MNKYILIAAGVLCIAVGSGGTLYIAKLLKPEVKIVTQQVTCPEAEKIDFSKIKGRNVTVENKQFYSVNADSAFTTHLNKIVEDIAALNKKLDDLKVVRCKK